MGTRIRLKMGGRKAAALGFTAALFAAAASLLAVSSVGAGFGYPGAAQGADAPHRGGAPARAAGIVSRLLYAIVVVALLIAAAALAAAIAPRAFGYGTVAVSGGSMGESFPNGSLVITRALEAEELRTGDVILIRQQDGDSAAAPKLHRIVSLQQDGPQLLARTRGDANAAPDPDLYILPSRVHVPVTDVPYLGFLVRSLRTPLGWLAFIALPAILIGAVTVRGIWTPPARAATGQWRP